MRHLEVRVAYGTSKRTMALHGGEFTISSTGNRDAYDMAGLSYDTKFDLKRAIDLPDTSEWFTVPPAAPHGQTPKSWHLASLVDAGATVLAL
jgi:hypothetical protein